MIDLSMLIAFCLGFTLTGYLIPVWFMLSNTNCKDAGNTSAYTALGFLLMSPIVVTVLVTCNGGG